jgi:hypothetical protein
VISRVGDDVDLLVRARLGSIERGCEISARSAQAFGGLLFIEVLLLSVDSVTKVLTLVFYSCVEH